MQFQEIASAISEVEQRYLGVKHELAVDEGDSLMMPALGENFPFAQLGQLVVEASVLPSFQEEGVMVDYTAWRARRNVYHGQTVRSHLLHGLEEDDGV
jgi:hypothetical protein